MPRLIDATATRTEPHARRAALDALAAERFDVLVIGAGITGAGVARDAAMRGLRVALVDRSDVASGTSSRSSRLVHGGVRYLEHGHLGLVFEASRERRILLRTAPHLVRPLAFTWPVYRGARVPRWKLSAGLALYDALALFRNVASHRPLGRGAVLRREPALRGDGLLGGAAYHDAATDDARLTLATALAARDAGAVVVTHAAVRQLAFAPDGGVRATIDDALGGGRIDVAARVAVNAAGPWGDAVRRLTNGAGPDPSTPSVLGAKGAHVAVAADRVGNHGALTLLSPLDGRVMFVLPAGPHSIIGTTETPADAGPDDVRATEADVDYLLRSANAFFPDARLGRGDTVAAWAGIRPLAATHAAGDGTASVSREHVVERDARGLVTVSGGKLTTYRAMAREVVDAVAALLGRRLTPAPTDRVPLPGGDVGPLDAAIAEATRATSDATVAGRLVHAHGSAWRTVWARTAGAPELAQRIVPELPYVRAELAHAVEHELACTLGDLLIRRTPIAYETRDAGRAAARVAAPIVAPLLGWDDAGVRRALDDYDTEAARIFAVDDR